MGDDDTARAGASRDFPLVFTEGDKRFVRAFKDEGVTLTGAGLAWTTAEGVTRSRRHDEIAAIHLRVLPIAGEPIGQCRIAFRGGDVLNVMGWKPSGFADAARAQSYREFVAALHAELAPADRARIAFTSGIAGMDAAWRRIGGNVLLVGVPLVIIVPSLWAALVADDPRGYWLALAGVLLTSGLSWKLHYAREVNAVNKLQAYAPDAIPAALMP